MSPYSKTIIIKTPQQFKQEKDLLKQEQVNVHLNEEKIKNTYLEYDSKNIPATLFFHPELRKQQIPIKYLYIKTDQDSLCLENKRIEWLKQHKLWTLYQSLYKRIYKKETQSKYETQSIELVTLIENDIKKYLSENNNTLLTQTLETLQEYKNTKSKSKKTKEQFGNIINNFTNLVKKTRLRLDLYYSYKYHIYIPLNISEISIKDTPVSMNINSNIHKLKQLQDNLEKETQYIQNIRKHLEIDLVKELEIYETQLNNPSPTQSSLCQNQNWGQLSKETQLERLLSFSNYYIETTSPFKEYTTEQINSYQTKLYNYLSEVYSKKNLTYNYIKWNKTKGEISNIRHLIFDNQTMCFLLESPKKSTSSKETSIVSSTNETIYNNILLKYITKYGNSNLQLDKKHLCDYMKKYLGVTKLSNKDKTFFINQIQTMLNLLQNQTHAQ